MRAWLDVAQLIKWRNDKEAFSVRSSEGLPFLLEPSYEVAFVPPVTDAPRAARVVAVNRVNDSSAWVTFSFDQPLATPETLVGCHCLVKRDLIPKDAVQQRASYEHWHVVDIHLGMVGSVSRIIDMPAQPLLEVDRGDASEKPVLIPLAEDFIVSEDTDAHILNMDLPQGLLNV